MTLFTVRLRFHGGLAFFLKPKNQAVERQLAEKSSIKDIIESCGVPHPEVDLILLDGQPISFSHAVSGDAGIGVYPILVKPTLFPKERLQVHRVKQFVADGHLGKLVRDLRLLGFDVLYDRDAVDSQLIARIKTDSQRALLTRDRRLLMHAVVRHGYYLRSQNPIEQTLEVLRRFELFEALAPFTRCLRCNAALGHVEKSAVIEKLEPLTKIYYDNFRRCTGCGQVYWTGSHFPKLSRRVEQIRASATEQRPATTSSEQCREP